MTTDVIVIGDPARTHDHLSRYRMTQTAPPATKHFDNATDTWTVTTGDGRALTGRLIVDTTERDNETVAGHGVPNYFRIPGPHTERQARYVAGCIDGMHAGGATRIEARSRIRVRKLLPTRGLSRFHLTGTVADDDELYDGPAVLTYKDRDYQARVLLTGHFDPIDGQYHWQGMLYAELPDARVTGARVGIRVGEHTAAARISEQTPWGSLAVIGAAGYPPFALDDVEISAPPRA